MRYDAYKYLFPPRPEKAVSPEMLGFYDQQGWVAQIKKNGTCSVIAVSPTKELVTMNRHNETHKLWDPTPASSAAFKALPGTGWYVFVAELLHSKVAGGPRDTNYLFDILVSDGEYLVGKTFAERADILDSLFPDSIGETQSHRIINSNTWVAKRHSGPFRELFDGLTADEDEGIVLKNPRTPLEFCFRKTNNASGQVKSRRQHKNYGF
jgi:hypothetical protein